jgi:hypothetical protein
MTLPLRGFNDEMTVQLPIMGPPQRRTIEAPMAQSHFVIA